MVSNNPLVSDGILQTPTGETVTFADLIVRPTVLIFLRHLA